MRAGWLLSFFERINRSWPHAGHRLVNCGEAASRIDYFATCLGSRIDTRADLVVVGARLHRPAHGCWRAAGGRLPPSLERALRLVLRLPRRPAVLLFNSSSWRGPLEVARRLGAWNYCTCCRGSTRVRTRRRRDVAEYYGVPVVSNPPSPSPSPTQP